jgi:hypothetical protein
LLAPTPAPDSAPLPTFKRGVGRVDVLQGIGTGQEFIEQELARLVHLDQVQDIDLGRDEPYNEPMRVFSAYTISLALMLHLHIGPRHTNHDARPILRVACIRLFDGRGQTDGFEA